MALCVVLRGALLLIRLITGSVWGLDYMVYVIWGVVRCTYCCRWVGVVCCGLLVF